MNGRCGDSMDVIREVILCKYGEVILKGANRNIFEVTLAKELRYRAAHFGKFKISYAQSTMYIEPQDADADIDGMYEQAKRTFGFNGVTRAAVADKNMDDIIRTVKEYLPERLEGHRSFRCEAKRSDKRFPLKSPEIAGLCGEAILDIAPHLKVDLSSPDITVRIEIRENAAYIHAGQEKGAGGLPLGTSGKGMLLLSGGIDSPVAGYMMAKRGLSLDCLYFESFPYTSEMAREKVISLAKKMSEYCGRIRFHIISLTHIQEEIRDKCTEDYMTLLLRRFMMRLADRLAKDEGCGAIITGESLGQVASQTLAALRVTDIMADMPVFRPCIGMDKDEIVTVARKIGTFDISSLPYEDCCTVFTPKHPKTQPNLEGVLAEEEKLDVEALVGEAYESHQCFFVRQFEQ